MSKDNSHTLDRIIAEFGVPEARSFEKITAGYSSEVYRVSVLGRPVDYAVHIWSSDKEEFALNQMIITESLGKLGVITPRLQISAKGQPYYRDDSITAVLHPWIGGINPKTGDLKNSILENMGRQLAFIHTLVKDLPFRLENKLLDDSYQSWLVKQSTSFLGQPGVTRLRESAEALGRGSSADLPKGIVHGDYHRNNLLLHDNGIAILDFERSGPGILLFDIARAALDLCSNDNGFVVSKNDLFLHGYESVRKLEEPEKGLYAQATAYAALAVARWFDSAGMPALRDQFIKWGLSAVERLPHFQ